MREHLELLVREPGLELDPTHEPQVPREQDVIESRRCELGMSFEQLGAPLPPLAVGLGCGVARSIVEGDQLAPRIAFRLQAVAVDHKARIVQWRVAEQRFELVASGHPVSYRRMMAGRTSAVLFELERYGHEMGSHPLSVSATTVIDNAATAEWRRVTMAVTPVDGAWQVRTLDGDLGKRGGARELTVRTGETFRVRYVRFRVVVSDDLDRTLDDERYLNTVIDPLSGTFNRRFLRSHAGRLQPPTALLLVDLDHFKQVNDQRGFQTGDAVLTAIADRLLEQVRWPELVVRYGGEEFAVILPAVTHDEARERAERIRRAVAQPLDVDEDDPIPFNVTISIGLTMFGTGEDALADAMRRADENLGRAKEQGRDRVIG